MRSFDVPTAMNEVLELAGLLSPSYATWIEQRSRWIETYQDCPKIDTDTVVVAAGEAWELYQQKPFYVCRVGRYFRNVSHMAFYENKKIHRQVPHIIERIPDVEWDNTTADELQSSSDRNMRKVGRFIKDSLSPQGQQDFGKWAVPGDHWQVFILTPYGESPTRDDGHMLLKSDIPHNASGRGSAFTQGQRYVSRHRLGTAQSTADLVEM